MIAPSAQDYRQAQGVASSEGHAPATSKGRRVSAFSRRGAISSLGTLVASCALPGAMGGASTRLVYGSGGSIIEVASDGSGRAVRVQPPVGGVARDPTWSPDGKRILYAYTPPIVATRGGGPESMLPVSDLYALDISTGTTRIFHAHASPGESLERPVWTRDGAAVLASVLAPVFEGGAVREVRKSVVRIPVGDASRLARQWRRVSRTSRSHQMARCWRGSVACPRGEW